MLGFHKKTRSELMRDELGSSWEHFLQAATYAANGVGSTVGPGASKVRGAAAKSWDTTAAAIAPLAEAYRHGAADAQAAALKLAKKSKKTVKGKQQMSNRKTGMLIGLLVAGAAVGAAGALVMRRRRKQQWSDYDPSDSFDSMSPDARSMIDKASNKADKAMDKAASHANRTMDKAADKLDSAASSMRKTDFKSRADEASDTVSNAADEVGAKFSSVKHNSRP
jgi:gas vesicle protein